MTYRDEFDEPPRGKNSFLSTVGPKAAFFVVLIALSFMVGVVWKLYVGGGNNTEQTVPIVRADDQAFKVIPDDPGGMEIPNKDSTIFSSLKDKRAEEGMRIENLLADDDNEEPMPRSQLFAGLNTDEAAVENAPAPAEKAKTPAQTIAEKADEIKEAVEEIEETVQENIKAEPVVESKPASTPTPAPVSKPASKPAPKPVKAVEPIKEIQQKLEAARTVEIGDYYIQLASVKSREGAESEWKKLQKKYTSQLSGYSHRVEQADLGAKGIFYRIQAGPASKNQAIETCNAIKAVTAGGCLVKKK